MCTSTYVRVYRYVVGRTWWGLDRQINDTAVARGNRASCCYIPIRVVPRHTARNLPNRLAPEQRYWLMLVCTHTHIIRTCRVWPKFLTVSPKLSHPKAKSVSYEIDIYTYKIDINIKNKRTVKTCVRSCGWRRVAGNVNLRMIIWYVVLHAVVVYPRYLG